MFRVPYTLNHMRNMVNVQSSSGSKPFTDKLINWNFHLFEVVSRWRDPQLQVNEHHSDLTILWNLGFIYSTFKSRYLIW